MPVANSKAPRGWGPSQSQAPSPPASGAAAAGGGGGGGGGCGVDAGQCQLGGGVNGTRKRHLRASFVLGRISQKSFLESLHTVH